MYGDKHSSHSIGIHNDCDNFKLLNIGWSDDGGEGVLLGDRNHQGKIYAVSRPCLFALTARSTKLYPAFLTPDTPSKGSGPVTADSEGGADGSGTSRRLAIGN